MSSAVPPVAKKVPYSHTYHGRKFEDPFHWIKDQSPDKKRTDIVDYIKLENEYAQSHFKPNETLADSIYNETISRIQEEDQDVPYFRAPYYYYKRTGKGLQYPVYCRKKDSLDGTEEVLLDQNNMDHEYMDLGAYEVSPNHELLAYSLDLNGSENYKVFFKNLATGEIIENETIEVTSGDLIWYNDNKSVFYSTLDDIHRPEKIWLHKFGVKDDVLIYHEEDPKFYANFFKSQSQKYLFLASTSTLTSEYHYIDITKALENPKLILAREEGHRYSVEHQGDRFLILTNGKKKYLNYRLCSCPIQTTDQSAWEEVVPYDPLVNIKEVLPFKNHIACRMC